MSAKIIIGASILSANLAHLGDDAKNILKAGVDVLHFDVMDHHFVPNLTFGAHICSALRKDGITAPIDVHLMVTHPEEYIESFAQAGANRLTFHPETSPNPLTTCEKIHAAGMQAGLAFNPDKAILISEELLAAIDMILVMSVFAGFGGQAFIVDSLNTIRATKKLIDQHNSSILLGVDGGIKVENIAPVVAAGANCIVIGSGLFDAADYTQRVRELREKCC